MSKYKDRYRIASNRLEGWDYGANAIYFITICCKNKKHFFGEVKEDKMKLSPIGHIANSCWIEITNHFSFVVLHNHIIMPNHIHGIIEIAKSHGAVDSNNALVKTSKTDISTPPYVLSDYGIRTYNASKGWRSDSLGTIINQYKRICTINGRKIDPDFAWQSNYHDHIIRNYKSFRHLTNYIINNPIKWHEDEFYSENDN